MIIDLGKVKPYTKFLVLTYFSKLLSEIGWQCPGDLLSNYQILSKMVTLNEVPQQRN